LVDRYKFRSKCIKTKKPSQINDRVFMLLTNQKTINYENLYEIQKGTTPFFFTSANIQQFFELYSTKNQL
jgi:hypothetical protein